jgi:hypothetical protein
MEIFRAEVCQEYQVRSFSNLAELKENLFYSLLKLLQDRVFQVVALTPKASLTDGWCQPSQRTHTNTKACDPNDPVSGEARAFSCAL